MQAKSGGYGDVLMLSKQEGRTLPVFRNRKRHSEERERKIQTGLRKMDEDGDS